MTKKALALGLRPILVVNKVDKPGSRPNFVVNAAFEFVEHTSVIDAASDVLVEVFCEAGRHSRLAVGVSSLPANLTLEKRKALVKKLVLKAFGREHGTHEGSARILRRDLGVRPHRQLADRRGNRWGQPRNRQGRIARDTR